MASVKSRKQVVVQSMREMNLSKLQDALADHLIIGTARFVALKTIEVTTPNAMLRWLSAERFFINTGTRPLIPKIPGLAEVEFLTSESIMELEKVPSHLIILGGGYIGLEFAQMFCRFGSRVTLISQGEQLLTRQDPDIAVAVKTLLEEEGVEFLLSTKILCVEHTNHFIVLRLQCPQGEQTIRGSHLLVAVGRTPNTEVLNLAVTGVAVDTHGFIIVNNQLETNVPGIWALGDVNGGPQFTHVSLDDYRIIKANLLGDANRSTYDRLIPSTLFIDPELAHVGLTETEARQRGHSIRIAKLDVSMVPRAKTLSETKGLMKAIVDAETGLVLGCSLLCHEAGEVIGTVQMLMIARIPYTILRDAVLAHPTMVEGLNQLFAKL